MTVRQQKVAAQIRRVLAELLAREVADPRVAGLVSITRVEVTPDLREARVFVSVFSVGGPPGATVVQGLQSSVPRLQAHLGKAMAMRVAPRLEFRLDESLKKQAEILRQLDSLEQPDAP